MGMENEATMDMVIDFAKVDLESLSKALSGFVESTTKDGFSAMSLVFLAPSGWRDQAESDRCGDGLTPSGIRAAVVSAAGNKAARMRVAMSGHPTEAPFGLADAMKPFTSGPILVREGIERDNLSDPSVKVVWPDRPAEDEPDFLCRVMGRLESLSRMAGGEVRRPIRKTPKWDAVWFPCVTTIGRKQRKRPLRGPFPVVSVTPSGP